MIRVWVCRVWGSGAEKVLFMGLGLRRFWGVPVRPSETFAELCLCLLFEFSVCAQERVLAAKSPTTLAEIALETQVPGCVSNVPRSLGPRLQ